MKSNSRKQRPANYDLPGRIKLKIVSVAALLTFLAAVGTILYSMKIENNLILLLLGPLIIGCLILLGTRLRVARELAESERSKE